MRIILSVALLGISATVVAQPPQRFRAATRLVEVSVVVTDRVGKPITGLTREDFTLQENGTPHAIAFFEARDGRAGSGSRHLVQRAQALAPGASTNRMPAGDGTSTVILLDRINGTFASQWYGRLAVEKYLSHTRSGERIALYVLDGPLRVLHDFTTDAESLRASLDKYTARQPGDYDASNTEAEKTGDPEMDAFLAEGAERIATFYTTRRVRTTFDAFELLAEHLVGVTGSKGIVWVSEAIPMSSSQEFTERLRRAAHALSTAGVTVYPVDTRGLVGAIRLGRGNKPVFTSFADVRGNIETMQIVAEETGGRAFYNTNALERSIARAVDDSQFTYVLGYYPSDERWDGRYRRISVTANRKNLLVRHRRGYIASPPPTRDAAARDRALRTALESPLNATAVAITAVASRAPVSSDITLEMRIDPDTVTLVRDGTDWVGSVDVLVAQMNAAGRGVVAASFTADLRLSDDARAQAREAGITVTRTLSSKPRLPQLRIVARDVP